MSIALLTPKKVGDDRKAEQLETQLRVNGIAAEESRLIVSMNARRDSVNEEIRTIEQSLIDTVKAYKEKIREMHSEVLQLEERKRRALEPIDEQVRIASEMSKAIESQKNSIEEREKIVDAREKSLDDRERDIVSKSNETRALLEIAKSREARAGIMLADVAKMQSETILKIESRENAVEARERKVRTDEEHNENVRKYQAEMAKKLDDREKHLIVRYSALTMAENKKD